MHQIIFYKFITARSHINSYLSIWDNNYCFKNSCNKSDCINLLSKDNYWGLAVCQVQQRGSLKVKRLGNISIHDWHIIKRMQKILLLNIISSPVYIFQSYFITIVSKTNQLRTINYLFNLYLPVYCIGLKILYEERVRILHHMIWNINITHTSYDTRVFLDTLTDSVSWILTLFINMEKIHVVFTIISIACSFLSIN